MGNTSSLFDPILEYLQDYCVIVCELAGHSRKENSEFKTVTDSCEEIEKYVSEELDRELYGILGFSLGGTIVVELLARGKIKIERTIIDAGFNIKMGMMTYPFKWLFQVSIWCVKKDIRLPRPVVESVMGKGNSGIIDTLYKGVSLRSIGNACMSAYTYEMKDSIRKYRNPVVFWHGSNEPYPVKSAKLLRRYLPQLKKRVFMNMGHGQMLHEHPAVYAKRIREFLEEDKKGANHFSYGIDSIPGSAR
jgi:pimeloyl-ACP methyl ester carboxylesterase